MNAKTEREDKSNSEKNMARPSNSKMMVKNKYAYTRKVTEVFIFFCALASLGIIVSPASCSTGLLDATSNAQNSRYRRTIYTHYCGDVLTFFQQCECSTTKAWCSGRNDDIHFKYIPRLPDYITELEFYHNFLPALKDKSFFLNVTQLEFLDLTVNEIAVVSAGVFDLMPRLAVLVLDYNQLADLTSLRHILATRSLREVFISYCHIPILQGHSLDGIDSNVRWLRMRGNGMTGVLNMSCICNLRKLEILHLGRNLIHDTTIECVVSSLKELQLAENAIYDFIPTCGADGESLFPELERLDLSFNNIRTVPGYEASVCLPNLKELLLEENSIIGNDYGGLFDAKLFPVLQHLDLTKMGSQDYLYQLTFDNSIVQFLSLAKNLLDFSTRVDNDTFATCRNITHLVLDQNDFSSVSDERFQLLFGHLPLVNMSLRQTQFSDVSQKTFSHLTQLQLLDLSNNKIVHIPKGTFDHLISLRRLYLTKNKIYIVSILTFGEQLTAHLNVLRIDVNPFACSCDLLWFRGWLRARPGLFQSKTQAYKCSDRPDAVSEFVLAHQACLLSREISVYIITNCTSIALAIVLVSLLSRYRWHVRLLLYESFRGRNDGVRQQRLLQHNFKYDVFVSYASEDLPWVRRHLMPQLEDVVGLRLCIHERDFIPGNNIVDNIADCVENSKKVMMLFSKHFVRSQWCQFELTYCLRHVMDYDDVLIVVCVDDVVSCEMTTAMMAVLKTTTYIQWDNLGDAVRAFWGRIQLALDEILGNEHRV